MSQEFPKNIESNQTEHNVKFIKMKIIIFIFQMLYIPIVIYVPALAFAQVTGMSLSVLIPLVCVVCIFYTCLVSISKPKINPKF